MAGATTHIRAYLEDTPKIMALIKAHRKDTGENIKTSDIIHSLLEIPEVKRVWEKILKDEQDPTK